MLRLVGILVTVLFAVSAAVLTWPGFFRVEQHFPVAQLISFRVPLAIGFLVIALLFAIIALARRARGFALSMAFVAIVACIANAVIVGSRGLGESDLPEPTAESIRVLVWNTAGEATDAKTIAQTAVAMQADVVSLPETTLETGEEVAIAMRELESPMWAHSVDFHHDGVTWDARSTTLLISPGLGDYAVIDASADGTNNTGVVPSAVAMPVDGVGPTIVAVHTVAPREGYMDLWRDDLRWIADQCEGNVIMAGDFNATVDHMARFGTDGGVLGACRDAASDSGNGAVGTWPADLPRLAGAPIDHVLYSSHWEVTGSAVLPEGASESDHRPLIVQLEPTTH